VVLTAPARPSSFLSITSLPRSSSSPCPPLPHHPATASRRTRAWAPPPPAAEARSGSGGFSWPWDADGEPTLPSVSKGDEETKRLARAVAKSTVVNAIEAARQSKLRRRSGGRGGVSPSAGPPPVTDEGLETHLVANIDRAIEALEALNPCSPEPGTLPEQYDGVWQLLFTKQDEIRRLESLPLGTQLGPVFNRVDVERGADYRLALVRHRWRLLEGEVQVDARFAPNPTEANRVDIFPVQVSQSLTRVVGLKTPPDRLRNVIQARPRDDGVQPATLITYLDEDFRVSRSANDDGRVVVFVRATEDKRDLWDGRKLVEGMREQSGGE